MSIQCILRANVGDVAQVVFDRIGGRLFRMSGRVPLPDYYLAYNFPIIGKMRLDRMGNSPIGYYPIIGTNEEEFQFSKFNPVIYQITTDFKYVITLHPIDIRTIKIIKAAPNGS